MQNCLGTVLSGHHGWHLMIGRGLRSDRVSTFSCVSSVCHVSFGFWLVLGWAAQLITRSFAWVDQQKSPRMPTTIVMNLRGPYWALPPHVSTAFAELTLYLTPFLHDIRLKYDDGLLPELATFLIAQDDSRVSFDRPILLSQTLLKVYCNQQTACVKRERANPIRFWAVQGHIGRLTPRLSVWQDLIQ